MLERAERVAVDAKGLVVPVVAAEDLIGLKLQAMINDPDRERQELADIRSLLEVAAAGQPLDGVRLREYFELFARTDLLSRLMEGLDGVVR